MSKQKLIVFQDEYGVGFCDILQTMLDEGWKVVPGTLGFSSVDVPVEMVGYTNHSYTKKVVCGYCVVEKED